MADAATLAQESRLFGRHLTAGRDPSEVLVARYVDAIGTGRFEPDDRDRRTLEFLARHPRLLGMVDGGLALRRPHSAVRKRLLLMTSILEASPNHTELFLPVRRSPLYLVRAGLVAMRAGLRGVAGVLLVAWI